MNLEVPEGLNPTAHILLIEDNYGDVLLSKLAFESSKVAVTITSSGEEALMLLRPDQPLKPVLYPDLILLDLNLPQKGGIEILNLIKTDPLLKRIPVVILTSSAANIDIIESYNCYANSYVIKPSSLAEYKNVVEILMSYWFHVVTLGKARD